MKCDRGSKLQMSRRSERHKHLGTNRRHLHRTRAAAPFNQRYTDFALKSPSGESMNSISPSITLPTGHQDIYSSEETQTDYLNEKHVCFSRFKVLVQEQNVIQSTGRQGLLSGGHAFSRGALIIINMQPSVKKQERNSACSDVKRGLLLSRHLEIPALLSLCSLSSLFRC